MLDYRPDTRNLIPLEQSLAMAQALPLWAARKWFRRQIAGGGVFPTGLKYQLSDNFATRFQWIKDIPARTDANAFRLSLEVAFLAQPYGVARKRGSCADRPVADFFRTVAYVVFHSDASTTTRSQTPVNFPRGRYRLVGSTRKVFATKRPYKTATSHDTAIRFTPIPVFNKPFI